MGGTSYGTVKTLAKSGPTSTDDDALPNLVEESANPGFPQTTFCSCFTFTPSGIELAKVEGEEEQPSLPPLFESPSQRKHFAHKAQEEEV